MRLEQRVVVLDQVPRRDIVVAALRDVERRHQVQLHLRDDAEASEPDDRGVELGAAVGIVAGRGQRRGARARTRGRHARLVVVRPARVAAGVVQELRRAAHRLARAAGAAAARAAAAPARAGGAAAGASCT